MRVSPYLNFNGQCEEAFKFYAQLLGGKIDTMSPFGDTPAAADVKPEWKTKIMHASMSVGQDVLMGSDAPHDQYQQPAGTSVSLQLKEADKAKRIFNGLAEKGQVILPFQKTFWSDGFGMCVDRFGTPWMVNVNPEA
jgi:PhnB protein